MAPPEVKTGVVLLAAGLGKRFGGGKLTAKFRGRPLWEWAARTAESLDFREYILVRGPKSPIRSCPGWRLVENPVAEKGMGSSIAVGVGALTDSDRVIIMLADMPFVSRAHLSQLMARRGVGFTQHPDGVPGCPAIFPKPAFAELEGLTGEQGARSLDFDETFLVSPADSRELADIDTVRDLEKLASEPDKIAPLPR